VVSFRLVNLQHSIFDAQRSLFKVIENLDASFSSADINSLVRGIRQRQDDLFSKFPCRSWRLVYRFERSLNGRQKWPTGELRKPKCELRLGAVRFVVRVEIMTMGSQIPLSVRAHSSSEGGAKPASGGIIFGDVHT
jgi:hypothetical protein